MSMSDPHIEVNHENESMGKKVSQKISSHNVVNGNKKRLSADLPDEPPAPEEEEELNLSKYTEEENDSIIKDDDQDISQYNIMSGRGLPEGSKDEHTLSFDMPNRANGLGSALKEFGISFDG